MSKYLITNADDFGYNPQQNEAIKELLTNKLISSTSVLAVAPEFKDAADWLKKNGISAGVHLTINSDEAANPWKSLTGAKSLGNNGALFSNSKDITLHTRHRDVRRELEAQYTALRANGVKVDHADNHSGTLYGLNLRRFYVEAYDFCALHNLPYRFPKRPDFIERQLGRKVPSVLLKFHAHLVNKALKQKVMLIDDLITNPWDMNKITSREMLFDYYLNAVRNCGEGITELFMHPAKPISDEITPWTKRVYEYEILKSGDLLEVAKDKGIEIISWSDVEQIINR